MRDRAREIAGSEISYHNGLHYIYYETDNDNKRHSIKFKKDPSTHGWMKKGTGWNKKDGQYFLLDTLLSPFWFISEFYDADIDNALSVVNGKEIDNILTMEGIDIKIDSDKEYYVMTFPMENHKYGYFMKFMETKINEVIGYLFHTKDSIIVIMYDIDITRVSILKKGDDKKYSPYAYGEYRRVIKDTVVYSLPIYQKMGDKEYVYTIEPDSLLIKKCKIMVNPSIYGLYGITESKDVFVGQPHCPSRYSKIICNHFPILFQLTSYNISESFFVSDENDSQIRLYRNIKKNMNGEMENIGSYIYY